MMKSILRPFLLIVAALCTMTTFAAKPQIVLQSDPEGATVYLNGRLVCVSTPAIITVSKKEAGNPMMFQFVKEGYEKKTITQYFTEHHLKNQPTVSCSLERIETPDPGIRSGHQNDRVSRDNPGKTDLEKSIIRWSIDSDPRGARVFWRVISSVPDEVKNTNETYLGPTPYEETRGFNIQGLTYDNARDVTIEIKISKRGYEDQVRRFNVRSALDQQEISTFLNLVEIE